MHQDDLLGKSQQSKISIRAESKFCWFISNSSTVNDSFKYDLLRWS
jgi:hypothetical protein